MSLDRVFVIGAGLMGHGIAQVSAAAGKQVTLADRTAELAEKGKDRVAANLARQVEKGKLSAGRRRRAAWSHRHRGRDGWGEGP